MRIEAAELESLPVDELVERLEPVMCRAKIGASAEAYERNKENLPAAMVLLAHAWQAKPQLSDGRQVDFTEYVVAKLGTTLRTLYREQNPDAYDGDRHDLAGVPRPYGDEDPTVPGVEEEIPEQSLERLAGLMRGRIDVASQPGALAALAGVDDGSISTPRQFSKALGLPDYKSRPATQAFLAAAFISGRDQVEDKTKFKF